MRRILLPVDGSRSSASALEYLLERKKRGERARIDVLLVQPAPLVMNKEVANILLEEQLKVFSDRSAFYRRLTVIDSDGFAIDCRGRRSGWTRAL